MGMPAAVPPSVADSPYFTVQQVLAMPDDGLRRELVYGELLVSPAPRLRHQLVAFRLARSLADYCDREGIGRAFMSPADLTWGRNDLLVMPDVFVIGADELAITEWQALRNIPFVAEITSPSTRGHDRFRKRAVYRDQRVSCYWIIDPESGPAEVWTPGASFPTYEAERLTWQPTGASSPFVVELAGLRAP